MRLGVKSLSAWSRTAIPGGGSVEAAFRQGSAQLQAGSPGATMEEGSQSAEARSVSEGAGLAEECLEPAGRIQVRMFESDQVVKSGGHARYGFGWLGPHHTSGDRKLLTATGEPGDHHPSCGQALVEGNHHSHFVDPGRLALQEVQRVFRGPFDPALDQENGRRSLGFPCS